MWAACLHARNSDKTISILATFIYNLTVLDFLSKLKVFKKKKNLKKIVFLLSYKILGVVQPAYHVKLKSCKTIRPKIQRNNCCSMLV